MKLYLVRHGQSETNLAGEFTGWKQVSLTEKGYADAARAGEYLKGRSFDRIYSSDLIRAVQTAKTALPGCEPEQLPWLREIGLGSLEGRSIARCMEEGGEEFANNRENRYFVPYGGESEEMLDARLEAFLRMLEENPCGPVIAFSHAGILRAMLKRTLGFSLQPGSVLCENGAVCVYQYKNGRWQLKTWGAATE